MGDANGTADMRAALEAAILAHPEDIANHMAYADWLAEQGDPRGEFIQVQMRLEQEGLKAADRKKLQKREQELLKKYEREWLGSLAGPVLDPPSGKYEWQTLKVKYGWAGG